MRVPLVIVIYISVIHTFESLVPGIFSESTILYHWEVSQQFKPYQLVTNLFLHGNSSHLFGNCFFIIFYGYLIDKDLSKVWFINSFLIGGIVGSLFFLICPYFSIGRFGYLIGASSSVYTLAALALLNNDFKNKNFKGLRLIILMLSIELVLGISFKKSPVAHMAHFGGGLSGIVLYFIYSKFEIWKS